ncbi:hypothetical protein KIPB_003314 [Kipferlia bialata]|uniref:Uncharacterized protein n=1 Tax=Kipferlia bialata TaxID=797122 RepID=A0A391NKL3_9EUKA|nr:hypothetical protein KIPB_003314 [Kipferlia bialata]|eukprot:g3314.t1
MSEPVTITEIKPVCPLCVNAPTEDQPDVFIPTLATYKRKPVASSYEEILSEGILDTTRTTFDSAIEEYVLLPRGKVFSLKVEGLNIDAEAVDRIIKHNLIQNAFADCEDFDDSIRELDAPIPLPLRVNTYMDIAERYEGLSGETRKLIVLSHFDHMVDAEKPSLDLISSMIEWNISLKRGTASANYNVARGGCFGCCRPDDKKRDAFRRRVARENQEHERTLSKRKFRLEHDSA